MKSENKKFKKTEIGIIPEDWDLREFRYLFDVPLRNGLTRPMSVRGKGIKMINMGELFANERIRNIEMERVQVSEKEKEFYLLNKEDLLFARQSLLLSGVGKCSIILENMEPLTFEGHIIRTRLNKELTDPRFYFYFFKSKNGRKIIECYSEQVAAAGIRGSDLAKIPVPIPALPEQCAIAKVLSNLDDKIELNRRMNKTLESIAQAIFKHWFIDFEFPNEEGKPYKSSGGEMADSELGEIPEEWSVKKIEDVVSDAKNAIVDGPFGTQLHSDEYKSYGIPVIRIVNLSFDGRFIPDGLVYIDDEKFNDLKRSATYPGDILLAKTGATIGKLSILPSYINKAIIASSVLKITQKNNRYYIYSLIKKFSEQDYWSRISAGSTRSTINLSDVKKIKIIIPLQKILEKYELFMEKIYSMVEIMEVQNINLAQIRDLLLPKLMSGKIRVENF